MRLAPTICLLLLVPALVPAAGVAQQVVPVADEPRHFLVFENPWVRVIDARLPPGYISLFHEHAEDNVPVAIHGGPLEIEPLGGEARRVESTDGSLSFAEGGFAHRVSNLGETPIRYIDVEIVATPPGGARSDGELSDHRLELENDRVRVYRLDLAPGSDRAAHRHAGAVMQVVIAGSAVDRDAGGARSLEPGTFLWFEGGSLPAVEATGPSPLEIVEIEWR